MEREIFTCLVRTMEFYHEWEFLCLVNYENEIELSLGSIWHFFFSNMRTKIIFLLLF